ncbi:MAG: alpha/beta hydrolase, partial [Saprospiraceae bacterium]|nr:alpha/beta hydrolase [Saprospiraceae bacterium]
MRNALLCLVITAVFCCQQRQEGKHLILDAVPLQNETDREWIQGWLSVPENRGIKNSRTIELPFVLSKVPDSLKSVNSTVLIMSGGPGNSSLHMANGFTRSKVGSSGDVLVMDQRGTFYAKPYLNCPEIDSARIQGIKNAFFGQKLHRLHLEAVQDCYKRWITDGADLDGYNTLESAQDIEDLRNLLSIDQLILYGMSYSCKLMSAYAMTYPDRVRAMILDSPLPHESNYDEEAWAAIDGVFRAVLNY